MVKTSVNQIPSKKVDIFTKGNIVVSKHNGTTTILVTESYYTYDDEFYGVCISSNGCPVVGHFGNWDKSTFIQFSGEITIVVD